MMQLSKRKVSVILRMVFVIHGFCSNLNPSRVYKVHSGERKSNINVRFKIKNY